MTTGRIELEVLAAPKDETIAKALAAQPAPPYKATTADVVDALAAMGHYVQKELGAMSLDEGFDSDAWMDHLKALEKECQALSEGSVNYLGHVATTSADEVAREAATESLAHSGKEAAKGFLLKALADKSPTIRGRAARGLETFQSPEVIKRLVEVLKSDDDTTVRSSAVYALGHVGSRTATADLLEVLKTERDPHVLEAVFTALSWLKDESALPELRKLWELRPDPEFRRGVTNVIRNTLDPRFEGTVKPAAAPRAPAGP